MSKKICSILLVLIMILGFAPIVPYAAGAVTEIYLEATSYETDGIIIPYYEVNFEETQSYYRWLSADSADAPESEWKEIEYDNDNVKTAGYVTAETSYKAYLVLSQSLAGKYIKFELTPSDDEHHYDKVFSPATPMIKFTPNLLNNGSLNKNGINSETGEIYGWSDCVYDTARTAMKSTGAATGDNWYNRFDFPMELETGSYKFKESATYGSGASKNFRANYTGTDMGNGKWIGGKLSAWATGTFNYNLTSKANPYLAFRICTGVNAGAETYWMKELSLVKTAPYAKDAKIEGTARTGETVTASYNYVSDYDEEGKTEGSTVITWLKSDTSYGIFTEIGEGESLVLDPELEEKYIKIKITPKNSDGAAGTAITSEAVKVMAKPDEWNISEADGTVTVNYKNNRTYEGYPMFIIFSEYTSSGDVTTLENIKVVEDFVFAGEANVNTYTLIKDNGFVKTELWDGETFDALTLIGSENTGSFTEAKVPETELVGGVDIDYASGVVRMSGNIDTDAKTAEVRVYRPDTDYENIAAADFENNIEFYRSDIPITDGKYNIAFKLTSTNNVNSDFTVIISGKSEPITFKYFNIKTIDGVLLNMSNSNEQELMEMFEGTRTAEGGIYINDIFRLDLTEYNSLNEKYKLNIMRDLKSQKFESSNIAAIGAALEKAISEQKAVKELDDAIAYVTASSVSDMGDKIADKNDILKLDINNKYGYALSDEVKFKEIIHGKLSGITDSKDFYETFSKGVAAAAAKFADWGNILSVIETNNGVYNVDLGTKYQKLTKSEKTTLAKTLVKKTEKAATDDEASEIISKNFDDIVEDILDERNNEKESSSGGGGGIGGYSVPGSKTENLTPIDENTVTLPEDDIQPAVFADIEDASWAKEAILALAEKGIVKGTSSGLFEPNRNITRAEFLNMVIAAMNINYSSDVKYFSDVNEGDWYYSAVTTAAVAGIATGDERGRFNPGANITRQDMAVILYRAMVYCNAEIRQVNEVNIFSDIYSISSYALSSITKLQTAGIINGMSGNKFEPMMNASRAMAAKMIYGAISNS